MFEIVNAETGEVVDTATCQAQAMSMVTYQTVTNKVQHIARPVAA